MIILTMQDEEEKIDTSIDLFTKFQGYFFKKTFEIVSHESAEQGDVEERGWEVEKSDVFYCLESLLSHPEVKYEDWLEWSGCPIRSGDWVISEAFKNAENGKHTSYCLLVERVDGKPLTMQEMEYIGKTLGINTVIENFMR